MVRDYEVTFDNEGNPVLVVFKNVTHPGEVKHFLEKLLGEDLPGSIQRVGPTHFMWRAKK